MFSQSDIKIIEKNNQTPDGVKAQLHLYKTGFPILDFQGPAVPGKGIVVLSEKEQESCLNHFRNSKEIPSLFIPASGAASRMFKSLFALLEETAEKGDLDVGRKIMSLPFAPLLIEKAEKIGISLDESTCIEAARIMLTKEGLGLGDLPKALIPFHNYSGNLRTALEEQIREASCYLPENELNFHITVSPEHKDKFEKELEYISQLSEFKDKKIKVKFSFQEAKTNTIAADPEGNPFRLADGSLLFRPGGHGSLLLNLNEWDSPFFFVKNIDNITAGSHQNIVVEWKKILGGYLLQLVGRVHSVLKRLEKEDFLVKAESLAKEILPEFPEEYLNRCDCNKKVWLYQFLNRPIRVCGMVKADEATGGGPFRVKNKNGVTELQIVEEVQIPEEKRAVYIAESTHFNPVDLACWTQDYKGSRFDLMEFRDPETGFISKKSFQGKELMALEWPGLWNGAMAKWLTVFIEVPAATFNPVKTVFDLLKEVHQP